MKHMSTDLFSEEDMVETDRARSALISRDLASFVE